MKSVSAKNMVVWRPERSTALWTVALGASLVLNIVLFDLMPRLIQRDTGRVQSAPYIEKVNVIRIKRPEPQARRDVKKELPEPKKRTEKLKPKQKIYVNRSMKPHVDLPFEINPRLPAISGTVAVPPMQTVSLGMPDLNASYGVGDIDHPLTPLSRIPPIYPMGARKRGIEGWVRVRFIVNEEGRVQNIKIVESHPQAVFDRSVSRCVSAWRFKPGTVAGVPVKTWAETTVHFDLQKNR